jgi:hypothetical protein
MAEQNRFERFDPAEVLLLQYALIKFKGELEGENYSIILSRLVDEACSAPALPMEDVPGTRRDFEAVLRRLGVHDAEIEGTKNWPLANVEALVDEKAEADPGGSPR